MGMVAGEILDEIQLNEYSFHTIPNEVCVAILRAYSSTPSVVRAFLRDSFPVSSATFARVVRDASHKGIIEMQPQGGLPMKLTKAKEVLSTYPHDDGYSRSQQAAVAGASTSTIYRAALG